MLSATLESLTTFPKKYADVRRQHVVYNIGAGRMCYIHSVVTSRASTQVEILKFGSDALTKFQDALGANKC